MKKDRDRERYLKAALSLLEWEVKLYHQTKAELEVLKEEIILASKNIEQDMPKSKVVSDTTGNLAYKLLTNLQIREMEKRVIAIERAKDEFCASTKKEELEKRLAFIYLRFWNNNLTNKGIALRLELGTTTIYDWRKSFLRLVGQYLGWRM